MTIQNEDHSFNRSFIFYNNPAPVTMTEEMYDDYFHVLNIDLTDEMKVVEKAYRTLIRRFHPTRNSNPNSMDKLGLGLGLGLGFGIGLGLNPRVRYRVRIRVRIRYQILV